jgi:hypothetical protein
MTDSALRLILVYNADGGVLNGLRDSVWKAFRPSTYPCSLCALTFGWFAMHRPWRQFLDSLPHEKVYLHKDEIDQALPGLDFALPAILVAAGRQQPEVLVSANALDALPDLDALIALVGKRLSEAQVATAQA